MSKDALSSYPTVFCYAKYLLQSFRKVSLTTFFNGFFWIVCFARYKILYQSNEYETI